MNSMQAAEIEAQFSANRLRGEAMPDDLRIILHYRDELLERTGIELSYAANWAPWLDTSYLSDADLQRSDIRANIEAMREICEMTAFIAAHEDGNYYGYWRGPSDRRIADSPIICLDNEGQFSFCGGYSFSVALLYQTWSDEAFLELCAWLHDIGVQGLPSSLEDLVDPTDASPPNALRDKIYYDRLNNPVRT